MTDKWLCPVCGGILTPDGGSYRCDEGHCYDIAKSGYVNLIRSNKSLHGDDRDMIRARNRFLDSGYYAPLRDALCGVLCETLAGTEAPVCLDAGSATTRQPCTMRLAARCSASTFHATR